MRVLLVEDDPILGDGVQAGLRQEGYTVDWVRSGIDAELALETQSYAIILLDLGLPEKQGLDVLKAFRARRGDTPVLILTAKDAVEDRVAGLDAGADDYLIKPFDLMEVFARVRALVRRSAGRASPVIRHGSLELNPGSRCVHVGGDKIDLSQKEYAVLLDLLENAGRVRSRTQLEESLYGWDDELTSNAVEVHVHHLRKKLGGDFIQTIRGVGYMMSADESGRT